METLEAIRTRRSIRSFSAEPLNNADLQKIIEAAASAPSGGNSQTWLFISVCDPKHIAGMRAICPGIVGIPAGIIVLCLDFRGQKKEVLPIMKYLDIGAAMQNILLAAHDLGLGGCAIGSFHVEGVKEFLMIPEHVEPILLTVLGKPKSIPSAPRKKPLQEIYFQENFKGK